MPGWLIWTMNCALKNTVSLCSCLFKKLLHLGCIKPEYFWAMCNVYVLYIVHRTLRKEGGDDTRTVELWEKKHFWSYWVPTSSGHKLHSAGHVFFFVASAPSRFNREAFASSLPFYVNTSSGGRIRRQYGYTKLEEPVPARSLMLSNLGHG